MANMASLIFFIASFISLVSAAVVDMTIINKLPRGNGDWTASAPPCTLYFPPFDYLGCYDDSGIRVAPWVVLGLDPNKMTPGYCQAACKGEKLTPLPRQLLDRKYD